MKRTIITIAALAMFAGAVLADRFTPAVSGNSIQVEGTSTIHAWKVESSVINGQITAPDLEAWSEGTACAVSVTIPVASIQSGHTKMTKLMADALKAQTHPNIQYVLTEAAIEKSDADNFVAKTKGRLSIAGTTRDLNMAVTGSRTGTKYILTGKAPIRMTDFGIKPPTAMLNTIKTGPDVTVTFRWVVEETK